MANILPTEKKVLAVSMLAEGSSIRAIERVTGIHRDTVMRLGVRVGQACAKLHDEKASEQASGLAIDTFPVEGAVQHFETVGATVSFLRYLLLKIHQTCELGSVLI